ncbi:hypothetical protein MMC26_007106 [Xylographa opegraphella]|nr:hypothetical protein [Xylographa opegraphella]
MSSSSAPVVNGSISVDSDTIDVIKESYVVTLMPNLGTAAYEDHLRSVHDLCQRYPTLQSGRTAQVRRVIAEPRDHPDPTSLVYFGNFSTVVADWIRSRIRHEVEDIHEERLGNLAIHTTPSGVMSWGLSRISSTTADFDQQRNGYTQARDADKRNNHFVYNAIGNKGTNARVYVLDSGFHEHGPVNELAGTHHIFHDMDKYDKNMHSNSWLPWKWCQTDAQRRKNALSGHAKRDIDDEAFHGTNVTLCVGSSLRGSAPQAQVISVMVCVKVGNNARLAETSILDALETILDQNPEPRTIVNCLWTVRGLGTASPMARSFDKLHARGVQIVVAAGNAGQPLTEQYQTVGNKLLTPIQQLTPHCLDYTTIVGNLQWDNTKREGSNWIHPSPSGSKPGEFSRSASQSPCFNLLTILTGNLFIWAPGTNLPAWSPNGLPTPALEPQTASDLQIHGNLPVISGTSFAAPILSGVLACVLGSQQTALTPAQLQQKLHNEGVIRLDGDRLLLSWA